MELEVGGGSLELPARIERAVEGDSLRRQGILEAHAVGVAALPELVLVGHRAGGGARPEQRAAEARPLLVGPAHEPDGDGRRAALGDAAQHLDARDDVEGAVEPAPVRDGVDVPADQQGPLGIAPQREPLVAGLVDLLDGAGGRDLAGEPRLRGDPGVGPGHALGAVVVPGQLPELAKLGDGSTWVERHGGNV